MGIEELDKTAKKHGQTGDYYDGRVRLHCKTDLVLETETVEEIGHVDGEDNSFEKLDQVEQVESRLDVEMVEEREHV